MKKCVLPFGPFCLALVFLISCSKETLVKEETITPKKTVKNTKMSLRPPVSSATFVTLSGGNYISSYGGGMTFGSNLPHPTDDPNGYYDGYPIPTISYVNWSVNSVGLPSVITGPYFSFLVPTISSSTITNAEATINAIGDYHNAIWLISSTNLPAATKASSLSAVSSPAITATASGGAGVVRVSGMLIRDHLSPTKMSVVNEKYVTADMTDPQMGVGYTTITPFKFYFYAPVGTTSGPITKVVVTQNGSPVTAAAYSLTYTKNVANEYHTVGTVKMGTTVYNIDSWLIP